MELEPTNSDEKGKDSSDAGEADNLTGDVAEVSIAKSGGKKPWCIAAVVLGILALIFLILTIVFAVLLYGGHSSVDTKESPKSDKIYKDFTTEQYDGIRSYIEGKSDLNVVAATDADLNSNYIYSIDPILPPKSQVISYIDGDTDVVPTVKAKVTLFMGASNPKVVKEVLVYPIDTPTTMEEFVNPGNRVPSWQSRPMCPQVETTVIATLLMPLLKPLTPMLKAHSSYWYDDTCDFEKTCLFHIPVPKVMPGETDRHVIIFFWYPPARDDYYVWSQQLSIVLYTPGNGDTYVIRSLYYDNIEYGTIQQLVDSYNNGAVRNIRAQDDNGYENSFGSPVRRGKDVNPNDLPPPVQKTEAKRFSVSGRHVSWLGWEFDFHFSPLAAAQIFNLKFNDERIAYQIGVQDVYVKYTGYEPNIAFRNYMDAGWNMGVRATSLTKGLDCPESAEYISGLMYDVGFDRTITLKDSACVFEYRNHMPVRRHHSADFINPTRFRFTMSMPDVVLVFRQIITVWNYDYVVDVEIHQTGVISSSIHPTGYIQTYRSVSQDKKYGYNLLPVPGIVGVLHTHFFDVKLDVDIANGNSNRFKTVDIVKESKPHPYNTSVDIEYKVMRDSLKTTELDAIVHYDFTKPKEYIVYDNTANNSRNGNPRGYRIYSGSFVYPVVAPSDPLFTLASWVNHQIAVTKYKDDEPTTLSYFSHGDPFDPLISLKYFQEDDESILDEDLVCWVSLGVNHIPTSEDLPVTTTAGKTMSVYLIPHNYYEEDPSIASRDAELITPN